MGAVQCITAVCGVYEVGQYKCTAQEVVSKEAICGEVRAIKTRRNGEERDENGNGFQMNSCQLPAQQADQAIERWYPCSDQDQAPRQAPAREPTARDPVAW